MSIAGTQIASFKRPKAYFFESELPKNNSGKVLKTSLRGRFLALDRLIDTLSERQMAAAASSACFQEAFGSSLAAVRAAESNVPDLIIANL